MVKPISIKTFQADLEKIDQLESKFERVKDSKDESLKRLCLTILKKAPFLHTHGSSLLNTSSLSLKTWADERIATEKDKYSSFQRFAFRIAGIFKRAAFATKGESALKLSKKMNVVEVTLSKESPGLMARVASIAVEVMDDNKILERELTKISDRDFVPLFNSSKISSKEVSKVFSFYYKVDLAQETQSSYAFAEKLAEKDPSLLIAREMIAENNYLPAIQEALLGMESDKDFAKCVFRLKKTSAGGIEVDSESQNAQIILDFLITNTTNEERKSILEAKQYS